MGGYAGTWLLFLMVSFALADRFSLRIEDIRSSPGISLSQFTCTQDTVNIPLDSTQNLKETWLIRSKDKSTGLYHLCYAHLNEGYLSDFYSFSHPSHSLKEQLLTKFYTQPQDIQWEEDLDIVAFDGEQVYMPLAQKIYYKKRSKWKSSKPKKDLPGLILIKSLPEESNVYLNGIYMGKTPFRKFVYQTENQLLTLEKEGYYHELKFIHARRNQEYFDFNVFVRKVEYLGFESFPNHPLMYQGSPDSSMQYIMKLVVALESMKARIAGIYSSAEEKINRVFPRTMPQAETEPDEIYQKREKSYIHYRTNEIKSLKAKFDSENKLLSNVLEHNYALLDSFYTVILTDTIPQDSFLLERHDHNVYTLKIKGDKFPFYLDGVWKDSLQFDQVAEFKSNKIIIQYYNMPFGPNPVKQFLGIKNISLLHANRDIPLKGSYTYLDNLLEQESAISILNRANLFNENLNESQKPDENEYSEEVEELEYSK